MVAANRVEKTAILIGQFTLSPSVIVREVTTEPCHFTSVLWRPHSAYATLDLFGVSRNPGKPPTGRPHAGIASKIRVQARHSLFHLRPRFSALLGIEFPRRTRHHPLYRSRRTPGPSLSGTGRQQNRLSPSFRSLQASRLVRVAPIHPNRHACRPSQDSQRDLQSRDDLQAAAGKIALSHTAAKFKRSRNTGGQPTNCPPFFAWVMMLFYVVATFAATLNFEIYPFN